MEILVSKSGCFEEGRFVIVTMDLPSLGHLSRNHSYYYQTIFLHPVLFVLVHSRDGLITRLVDSTVHVFKGPNA